MNNNNNKKQQPSRKGKRRAAIGLVTCFVAVVAITGAYTWSNYRSKVQRELAQAEEEMKVQQQAAKDLAEEANADAKKAQEDEKDTQDQVESTEDKNVPFAEDENQTDGNSQAEDSAARTSGNTSQVNFTENSQLLWPVDGNVLMSFSMDKTVYFSTLDQYKYNPALILSGAVGDNVIAAAPGTVKSIDVLPQVGTTVTIDMGNGYECLYGQLKEVPVKVGDYVAASTVIGYLSEPTKYYSVEGCNLYFEMRKDGQPINPMDYMAEE